MIWNSKSLSNALGVRSPDGIIALEVQFNSRDVKEGDVFIALKGTGDGHDYVKDAFQHKASVAIVSRIPAGVESDKCIVVDDTYEALLRLANYKRKQSKAKFIAITGSIGKTTTKELLLKVLKSFGKTFASRGNFNNYLGVPLNLASIPDDVEYVIIEMGMNRQGELVPLTKMTSPDIALITNITPAHLQHFSSLQDVADAKSEIFQGLRGGIAVIPTGDHYQRLLDNIQYLQIMKVYTFGEGKNSNSCLIDYVFHDNVSHIKARVSEDEVEFTTKLGGKHYASNLISTLLIAKLLNLDLEKSVLSIKDFEALGGRGQIMYLSKPTKNFSIIYDCYNASPFAVQASLMHMKNIKAKAKVAVLGDMHELGENSTSYHIDLHSYVKEAGVNTLITVGSLMQNLYNEVTEIKKYHFISSNELREDIYSLIEDGDLILFKGSNTLNLYSIVEYLMQL